MRVAALLLGLLVLASCQVSRGFQENIELPHGTSSGTADAMVQAIWNGGALTEKIRVQFPNFDPDAHPERYGIQLRRFTLSPVGGEEQVSLQLILQFADASSDVPADVDGLVAFGKSIVERERDDYLRGLQ